MLEKENNIEKTLNIKKRFKLDQGSTRTLMAARGIGLVHPKGEMDPLVEKDNVAFDVGKGQTLYGTVKWRKQNPANRNQELTWFDLLGD